MENENAYLPPSDDHTPAMELTAEYTYTGPKGKALGNGVSWISSGFELFKQYPGQWLLTMVVGAAIAIVLAFIPFIGSLISVIISYVWIGGLMMGCQAIADGKPFKIDYLFAGFKHRVGALIGLSCISFVVSMAVMLAIVGSVYLDMIANDQLAPENMDVLSVMLKVLIAMALLIPFFMAVWFAPALIVLQNMSVLEAMKASFVGCLVNFLPFLIYGLVMLVLYIVGMIPFMLGLLVVIPILFGSMFASYQDIYLTKNDILTL